MARAALRFSALCQSDRVMAETKIMELVKDGTGLDCNRVLPGSSMYLKGIV